MPRLLSYLLACISVFYSVAVCVAQELPTAKPEDVGLSSQKLAKIKPAMQKFVDDRKVPGVITMVARRGKIVHFETVGLRDIDGKKPMERDTICRFYSMTKPITSTAVMMLVEQGDVSLDDSVTKFIPEFKDLKVFVKQDGDELVVEDLKRDITIRDLLRHTSGFTYGLYGNSAVDKMYFERGMLDPESSITELVTKLSKIPLVCQPGAAFNYSVSADVLGRMIEVVSGKTLHQFFSERIFGPLDMQDTAFAVSPDKLSRFANNYTGKAGGGLRVADVAATSRFARPATFLSGGGGLMSTARDYMRFLQMLLNNGQLNGKRLLKPKTVEMMTTNQLPKAAYPIRIVVPRPGVGFGFGFSVIAEKIPFAPFVPIGEYGWGGYASTHFWVYPQEELAVIVLTCIAHGFGKRGLTLYPACLWYAVLRVPKGSDPFFQTRAQCRLTQYVPFSMQLEFTVKPIVYDAIIDR